MCREHLIEGAGKSASLVGEVAHIVGEQAGAPRGGGEMALSERNAPDNLMLLCLKHHKVIDDDEETYTVEKLHEIRSSHLAWLIEQLAPAARWSVGISQYCYLNVPRLDEFAALSGFEVRRQEIDNGKTLRDLGYDLNHLMGAYRRTLERIAIDAVPVAQIKFAHEGYIGQLISFDRLRMRTKNMVNHDHRGPAAANFTFSGDLKTDPHIYHDFGDWRLVVNINPRWITTDTAYGMFRPSGGSSTFTGFARLTQVDYETRMMMATGEAIGLPPGLFDVMQAREAQAEPARKPHLSAFEDAETIARGDYWMGSLRSCDLCGKLFADETYMVDGGVKGVSGAACMCADCFSDHGRGLGWGYGQLYRQTAEGWLLVAGSHTHGI